jgi:4-amino-4-deoxy-L-arabinose transferase-like glycosyltransferase
MRTKILFGVIILSIIIGACTLRRGHEWGDDWAWYVLQAQSVLNGTTTEFIQTSAFTNNESTTYVGPLAYPWGYPLILAPAYAIKGINPLALKIPTLVFYAGFLACLYLLLKDRLTEAESLLIVSLFAFNPLLLQFLDQILSDIPFLFFSALSLWLITKKGQRSIQRDILIGVSIFLVTFLRATGIFLLGCFLIVEFFRLLRNRTDWKIVKQIVVDSFIVCVSFSLLWIANSILFPSGGNSYLAQYASMSAVTVRNLIAAYFNAFGLFFGEGTGWKYLYFFLVVFFLIGAWTRRKEEPFFLLFFGVWMIVHVAYPYWQGPRYIFPLLPIFIYFAFQGMKIALQRFPKKYTRAEDGALYGFWGFLALVFLVTSSFNAFTNLQHDRAINGPFDPYSKEVYKYIKEETPSASVVIFFKPRVMRLMTGHNTIMSTECSRMVKGDYLVLSRKVGKNQQIPPEEIGACNLPLNEVMKNSRFIVYEIQK